MRCLAIAALLFTSTAFAYEFDSKVPESLRNEIRGDLSFINSISSEETSNLHQEIFGPVAGTSYQNFFESRVTHIGLHSCGSPNAVACVIPWLGSSKIWFTSNYTKHDHPQVARIMVVYHEARHTEVSNGNWSHARCRQSLVTNERFFMELKLTWRLRWIENTTVSGKHKYSL